MKMNPWLLSVPALAASLQVASAADITGTIKLSGTPPAELVNENIAADPNCGKLHSGPVKTQFYVVGANQGLRDVVVTLISPDLKGKSTGASAAPLMVDQKGCEYMPYIAAVQTGQKITVKNSDPVLHNVHATPTASGNEEKNLPQAQGAADLSFSFSAPEDFLRFKCEVHAWMFSYITVVDHPYFAVTGADGSFKIANVPPGKYTIQATHRKASGGKPVTKEIEIKDGSVTADFTLEAPK
jgi:plastocyanin